MKNVIFSSNQSPVAWYLDTRAMKQGAGGRELSSAVNTQNF
jgi:hypothetical protein